MGWAGPSCSVLGQRSLTVEPWEFCHSLDVPMQVSPSQPLLLLDLEESGQKNGQAREFAAVAASRNVSIGCGWANCGHHLHISLLRCCAREQQSTEPRDSGPPLPPPPSPPAAQQAAAVFHGTLVVVVVVPVLTHTPLVTCHFSPASCLLSLVPLSPPSPSHLPLLAVAPPREGAFFAVACRIDRPSLNWSLLQSPFTPLHCTQRTSAYRSSASRVLLQTLPHPELPALHACFIE